MRVSRGNSRERLQAATIPRKLISPVFIEDSGRSAAWLARLVRDQEVEGSNPFAPTTLIPPIQQFTYALGCVAFSI